MDWIELKIHAELSRLVKEVEGKPILSYIDRTVAQVVSIVNSELDFKQEKPELVPGEIVRFTFSEELDFMGVFMSNATLPGAKECSIVVVQDNIMIIKNTNYSFEKVTDLFNEEYLNMYYEFTRILKGCSLDYNLTELTEAVISHVLENYFLYIEGSTMSSFESVAKTVSLENLAIRLNTIRAERGFSGRTKVFTHKSTPYIIGKSPFMAPIILGNLLNDDGLLATNTILEQLIDFTTPTDFPSMPTDLSMRITSDGSASSEPIIISSVPEFDVSGVYSDSVTVRTEEIESAKFSKEVIKSFSKHLESKIKTYSKPHTKSWTTKPKGRSRR